MVQQYYSYTKVVFSTIRNSSRTDITFYLQYSNLRTGHKSFKAGNFPTEIITCLYCRLKLLYIIIHESSIAKLLVVKDKFVR
jgi:hypothetical protein